MRLALALCALAACATTRPPPPTWAPPRADQAVELVCRLYGVEKRPVVYWRHAESGQRYMDSMGRMVWGHTPSPWYTNVSWWPGATFADTALAHELWHVQLMLTTGDTPDHSDPGFKPGGAVERAIAALRAWQSVTP